MTQKEATRAWDKWMENGYSHSAMPNSMALVMAYNALRGPTREQVRAIKSEWEKVDHLEYGELAFDTLRCGECEYEENINPEEKHPNFCPNCGSPMTKKGVLILCNRLEALKGETKAD